MAKRWTEEEDALLLKLRSEGFTAKEMTHYVKGRTFLAIQARVSLIAPDNKNRPWTQEEVTLALRLQAEGKPNKYIARAVDRTPRAVAAYLSRYWDSISSHTSVQKDV